MTVRSLIAFAITGLIVAPASRPAFADNPIAPIAPIAPTVPAAAAAAAAAKKKNEARERFALGLRLFESGDNSAALAEFKRAYEIFPNPLVLYNIGLVLAAMDRAVDAVGALDSFLNEGGKATAGEPGQRARRVRDEQAKRIAQLLVVTNKPASIEIDGVEAGRAPLERPLRLTSGAHVVSVMAPGCLPLRREVTLAGQVTETLNLTLLPTESNAAHLTVTVGVPGAQIIVNGKSVGLTPLAASIAVAPGTATVEARRAGYRPVSQTIRLDEGARGALTLTLTEDPAAGASLKGRLRLSVSESAPEISVDGAAQPGAIEGLSLAVGPHIVRVERGGFLPFERQIEIAAGKETALFVSLIPTAETKALAEERLRARRTWGWSVVATGAAVTAASGIYAVATRHDVSNAQANLNGQLALETEIGNNCFLGGPVYDAFRCGETKDYFQNQVDTAELKRMLALAGVGVGLATAAVGTYLLLTGAPAKPDAPPTPLLSLWGDAHGGGLSASGRF